MTRGTYVCPICGKELDRLVMNTEAEQWYLAHKDPNLCTYFLVMDGEPPK